MALATFDVDDTKESAFSTLAAEDLPSLEPVVPTQLSSLLTRLKEVRVNDVPADCLIDEILDRLLGDPSDDFLEECSGVFSKYGDALAGAVDVFSPDLAHHYNCLDTKFELKFFEKCDRPLKRRSPTIEILLGHAGAHTHYLRRRACAKVIATVHALKMLFSASWKCALGSRECMIDRFPKGYHGQVAELAERERYVLGGFSHWDAIVYELLCILAYKDLRFSVCTGQLDALLASEYHMIRPAVDAMDAFTLNIGIVSASYFLDVWSKYMRTYYPSVFRLPEDNDEAEEATALREEHTRSLSLPQWKKLVFYLPAADTVESQSHDEMLAFLIDFFQKQLTQEFLFSFKQIHLPPDYFMLLEEVFSKKSASATQKRPKRACVQPSYIDRPVRQKRR